MKARIAAGAIPLALIAPAVAKAQTQSERDSATAYGARLTAKGQPADQKSTRINNRINNRIDNRLSLRIERYRPDATANPTGAFRTTPDDKIRSVPLTPLQSTTDFEPQ